MLNKLASFIRRQDLIPSGETVNCAVSGGADSVALLFGLFLLKEKLGFQLRAVHFNHHLRGAESDRDESFVREFCDRYEIPLAVGGAEVKPGRKGLEAAAREARYAFFATLPGIIATAHTADDNAETLLLHLIRGTGLKGLGGIQLRNGNVIRPMLEITRQEVEAFLEEWSLPHIQDSSNETDAFLRNRIRHHVMPLLKQENPRFAENTSSMCLRLRQDEQCLTDLIGNTRDVSYLRSLHPALRSRALERILEGFGVREPEAEHISLAEALVFSENPSACGHFPGGVIIGRKYGELVKLDRAEPLPCRNLPRSGSICLPDWGIEVTCAPAEEIVNSPDTFTVIPKGQIILRSRQQGDAIRLSGGSKSLKKLMIDRKIPAQDRSHIPVICDEEGILGVYGIGANLDRAADKLPAIRIQIKKMN